MVNLDSEWMRHCGGVGRAKRHFDRAAARDNQEVVEMRNQQSGFTLIELVAVIVILGALAVVALPRFIDLQSEAETAALDGVKGGAEAAHANNLAGALASADGFQNISDCSNTGNLLQGGSPDGYSFGGDSVTSGTTGDELSCNVTQSSTGTQVSFTGFVVNE